MKQTATELAKKQREISVAEFFERNRHLLGFDNKKKALLTVVKEAVDNALDACEEAGVLPEIQIEVIDMGNDRFRVKVEDNGPGIVKKQIPNIFAKLLYGSKFHTMKQGRGQQGIGISAAVLYAQLTTGRPARITSKIGKNEEANYYELRIDTTTNKPEIIVDEKKTWKKDHGTKIELDIEASYQKGDQSVDTYIKETAIVNPHATLIYTTPKAEQFIFARATDKLPREPKEIKPHPYGVELGIMQKMLKATDCRTLQSFLTKEFSRVGSGTAKEICDKAGLFCSMKPHELHLAHIEKLMKGIETTKIIAPSTDCIVPIGAENLEKGLKKEINAEFYASITRSPTIYRGIPFVIECCTGDTKLTLENGETMNIKDFVESNYINKKVFSMNDDLKIVSSRVVAVHKIKNRHKILKIKTRTGKELKITANNDVPIIDNGIVVWKKVGECVIGDFIATPRQIKTFGEIPRIIDLLEPSHVQVVERDLVVKVIDKLKEGFGNYKNIAKMFGMNYDNFKALKRKDNPTRPTLEFLEKMCFEANEDFDVVKDRIKKIRYVDTNFKNPNLVSLPDINEDLLYVLGLLNSDGHISKYSVFFINLDERLHLLFKQKVENLFNLKAKRHKNSTYLNSKTVVVILKALMKNLTRLPDTLILAWLKGFVDGDGWVQSRENNFFGRIGIATAKKEKAELIQSLLLRFGIISKIGKQNVPSKFGKIKGREIITKYPQFNIIINDYKNAQKFYSLISFRQKKRFEILNECMKNKIKSSGKSDIIPTGISIADLRQENDLYQYQLGFSDQSIRQIEKNRQNITRNNLQQILLTPKLAGITFQMLKKLAFSDILWDKITDIEVVPNEKFVYDLTVENGNFLANNIVMHNCAIAYGGEQNKEGSIKLLRFANRVPLLYQQGSGAIFKGVIQTKWRSYGLSQSGSSLPQGPVTLTVHLASVWPPFTSEAKEAIAHYPEIIKEIRLALQECGRKLGSYIHKKKRIHAEQQKRSYIEKYIPHVGEALKELLDLKKADEAKVEILLKQILEKHRGKIKNIESENLEYDEELAKIGKGEE